MDIVISHLHMNTLANLAYMLHFRDILPFGTYMAVTFQSHDADSVISDIIVFVMLK